MEASRHFVNLYELQDKVSHKIAQLIGVESALVTTGHRSFLLGTAAAVAPRATRPSSSACPTRPA